MSNLSQSLNINNNHIVDLQTKVNKRGEELSTIRAYFDQQILTYQSDHQRVHEKQISEVQEILKNGLNVLDTRFQQEYDKTISSVLHGIEHATHLATQSIELAQTSSKKILDLRSSLEGVIIQQEATPSTMKPDEIQTRVENLAKQLSIFSSTKQVSMLHD